MLSSCRCVVIKMEVKISVTSVRGRPRSSVRNVRTANVLTAAG